MSPEQVVESSELYIVPATDGDMVKVRDELMDVKHLLQVNDDGLEQWVPVMKAAFPLSAADVGAVLAGSGRGCAVAPARDGVHACASCWTRSWARTPTCSRSRCTRGGSGTRSAAAWRS